MMFWAAILALGLACGADAFTVPSALPAQRLRARLPGSQHSPGRAARLGPAMMSKEVKERTVRAPIFEEVCEQTGITLSRWDPPNPQNDTHRAPKNAPHSTATTTSKPRCVHVTSPEENQV